MSSSLVTRLTLVVALILSLSFAAWLAIVHRSTSVTYREVQSEITTGADASAGAGAAIRPALEAAFARDGWSEVRTAVARMGTDADDAAPQVVVLDESLGVAAASIEAWRSGQATRLADGSVRVRAEVIDEGRAVEMEVTASNPAPLSTTDGRVWGHVLVLPPRDEAELGDPAAFAARVSRAAAIWLAGVVVLAMAATAWVIRRSLAPVDRLTSAARELQEGRVPARLQREGSSEIGALVDAFNAATAAIARTGELRRQWTADIAHELRTPVTNIKGQLEALDAGLVTADADFVGILQAETRQLERLVQDFHELAISDAGQLRLHLQPLPLRDTLEGILGPLADGARATWRVEGPAAVEVLADEERLRQVVANLVENAARYTPVPLVLEVVVRGEADAGVFELRDNGLGVAAADRPFIFDRFYRAEKSRSRMTGGSGLGLAIVQSLVQAMGGSIRYADVPGAGATFVVTLPRPRLA